MYHLFSETPWWKWYPQHLEAWRKHAKFWLEKYDGILHIIIYKDFVTDTKQQLSALMNFFGYTFEKATLHRHCCVLDHPVNTNIKRIPSVIDPYKETLMERDSRLKKLSDEVTIDIQRILDDRWPSVYRIKRGWLRHLRISKELVLFRLSAEIVGVPSISGSHYHH